jgi:hypothetical protein
MTFKFNLQLCILVTIIIIILLYWYNIKYNQKREGFVGEDSSISTTGEMNPTNLASVQSWYQNIVSSQEPPIYQKAYDDMTDDKMSPVVKFNLKIDPRGNTIDPTTGQQMTKLLVPIHVTPLIDGLILGVFNDGKLYYKKNIFDDQLWMGPLNNSLYGSQFDGIGMRMVILFPLNNNFERQIKLIGVGQDSCLYYKETEDLQSKWIKSQTDGNGNDNLVYLFCDYYQNMEEYYPLLYGITADGLIVYKNFNGTDPDSKVEGIDLINKATFTEPNPKISDNIKVLKVFWDRNGFLIGIGQDFRLYQKKGIDWKIRPWETSEDIRGTNPGANTKLIDIIMDNDARMIGLVLDSDSNPPMIRFKKQNLNYYLADFEEISEVSIQNKMYNPLELVKFKTGLDWVAYLSFQDPDEILYRSNNLQAIYQRSVISERLRLRNLCKNRNPTSNLEARNFDFERIAKEKEDKISQLTEELNGLLVYNPGSVNADS